MDASPIRSGSLRDVRSRSINRWARCKDSAMGTTVRDPSLLINHFRALKRGRTSKSLIQCPGVNAAISYSSSISISPIAN
ncbi:hypothetical protein CEXT_568611 [Caerostris extrusa]|uniref:Uncharacterized protein n=1 Tax=Caerostris extrusa TaxID=172846 RepID=A0AAV4YCX0_CAEEX|nr:hypothetical protein CEXT_568611 [Caerostris extrusa]